MDTLTAVIPIEEYSWLCAVALAVRHMATAPIYTEHGCSPIEAVIEAWKEKPETVTWLDVTGDT